jgi:hypothetical protein
MINVSPHCRRLTLLHHDPSPDSPLTAGEYFAEAHGMLMGLPQGKQVTLGEIENVLPRGVSGAT